MSDKFAALTIEMDGPTGHNVKVFLNGEDISRYLCALDFHIGAGGLASANLSFVNIAMNAELKAKILTNLEEGDDGESIS